MERRIGRWVERDRIDAVLRRRDLIVGIFDKLVASKGESSVIYDLPRTSEPCGAGLQ
jgi:hypothetical protein